MSAQQGYVIAFNPKAGKGRSYEALRLVTSRLNGRVKVVIETTTSDTFARSLLEAMRSVQSDTGRMPIVVALGGDGTVSIVLNALRNPTDAMVAPIPCGSGNDFASALGLASVSDALDALERGRSRRVDFGIVNGRRFANCVGMGLDAEVGAMAAAFRARGYPAGPSYYAAALLGLFRVKPVGVMIDAHGKRRKFNRGVMVTIGNGPLYGGGFRGAPRASLDDGLLDAYAFSNVDGVVSRFVLMQRIRAGTHVDHPNVTSIRGDSLVVEFDRDVAMHVDGEISTVRRAEIAVVPGGLEVIASVFEGRAALSVL